MKQAMREKNREKLSVIRMVRASLQNEAIQKGVEDLTEEDELTILSREVKQRQDSLKEFSDAKREDLVEKVEQELAILEQYLPEQLSEEELRKVIQETIEEVGATSKREFGKVMGSVMSKVKGKADGSAVRALVQELMPE